MSDLGLQGSGFRVSGFMVFLIKEAQKLEIQ